MQLETILCLSLDRSLQQEVLSCCWKRFYACLDRSVQQEMLLSSWKWFYVILCKFGQTCATGNAFLILHCWHELHFEFSHQNLNRNVQSPSMWWWLITQPNPILKKAPLGLQRPSHTKSGIPWVLYWLNMGTAEVMRTQRAGHPLRYLAQPPPPAGPQHPVPQITSFFASFPISESVYPASPYHFALKNIDICY